MPYHLVVAGESQYVGNSGLRFYSLTELSIQKGHLFDRRFMKEDTHYSGNTLTRCVRRFGRTKATGDNSLYRDHVTGSRMSSQNGHEVCRFRRSLIPY
jgi:hypothetical protein